MLLDKIIPFDDYKRKWFAVLVSALIGWIMSIIGIFILAQYGLGLFIVLPFLIGYATTAIYSFRALLTLKEAMKMSMLSLVVFSTGLLLFAMEGVICIAMAFPFGVLFTSAGALLAYLMQRQLPNNRMRTMSFLMLAVPMTMFVESKEVDNQELIEVKTSLVIGASTKEVWKNVIAFPELSLPDEWLFRAGIAYPIGATIEGIGVGAVRRCNFSTGSFVEPITVWQENELLCFDVQDCPAPMTELSMWDINAPHLHDYFVSKKGQFHLIPLADGTTKLEGTTWYYHRIRPAFYWKIWSNYIVHQIHQRVLMHIKNISENKSSF